MLQRNKHGIKIINNFSDGGNMKKILLTLATSFVLATSVQANDSAQQSIEDNFHQNDGTVPTYEYQNQADFGNDFSLWSQDSMRSLRRARLNALNAYAGRRYSDSLNYLFQGLKAAGKKHSTLSHGSINSASNRKRTRSL